MVQNSQMSAQDREKVIEGLRADLERKDQQHCADVIGLTEKYEKDRDRLERELVQHKKRSIELEGRLKRLEN